MAQLWPNAHNIALSNHPPGLTFQDVHGRIPHQIQLAEDVDPSNGEHRDLTLMRRAIETMGIDVQIVLPQPMLEIGLHPSAEIETQLIFAYNRWFTSRILAHEPRIKSMLALPFGSPEACLRTIDEFAGKPGVIGFLVTGQRQVGVYGPRACRSIAPSRSAASRSASTPGRTTASAGCSTGSCRCIRCRS